MSSFRNASDGGYCRDRVPEAQFKWLLRWRRAKFLRGSDPRKGVSSRNSNNSSRLCARDERWPSDGRVRTNVCRDCSKVRAEGDRWWVTCSRAFFQKGGATFYSHFFVFRGTGGRGNNSTFTRVAAVICIPQTVYLPLLCTIPIPTVHWHLHDSIINLNSNFVQNNYTLFGYVEIFEGEKKLLERFSMVGC